MPNNLTDDEWLAIMSCPGSRQILQTFRHIMKKRYAKLKDLVDKRSAAKKKELLHQEEIKRREEEPHLVYGLGYNFIFLRFYRPTMEKFENARVIWNFHEWGQPLVIDLVNYHPLSLHPSLV